MFQSVSCRGSSPRRNRALSASSAATTPTTMAKGNGLRSASNDSARVSGHDMSLSVPSAVGPRQQPGSCSATSSFIESSPQRCRAVNSNWSSFYHQVILPTIRSCAIAGQGITPGAGGSGSHGRSKEPHSNPLMRLPLFFLEP